MEAVSRLIMALTFLLGCGVVSVSTSHEAISHPSVCGLSPLDRIDLIRDPVQPPLRHEDAFATYGEAEINDDDRDETGKLFSIGGFCPVLRTLRQSFLIHLTCHSQRPHGLLPIISIMRC